MGKQHDKQQAFINKNADERPLITYFGQFDVTHKQRANRLLHFVCVPLMVFGILTLTWAFPFPQLGFLKAYNGYFNWASFVIAFWVYYVLKQSPLLSYIMLFIMFAFSYLVMQLQNWDKSGGLPLIWTGTIIIALAALGQYLGSIKEGRASWQIDRKLFLIAPLWVLHQLMSRVGVSKY
jgi:uncharacterized membrane protein YGL010W